MYSSISSVLISSALAISLIVLGPSPANAATLTVSFDPEGSLSAEFVTPGVPVSLYVVAKDLDEGTRGARFAIDGIATLGGFVLSSELLAPGSDALDASPLAFDVILDECTTASSVALARIEVLFVQPVPADASICLRAIEGAAEPQIVRCDGSAAAADLQSGLPCRFPAGCAIANPTQEAPIDLARPTLHRFRLPNVRARAGDVVTAFLAQDFQGVYDASDGDDVESELDTAGGRVYGMHATLVFDSTALRFLGAALQPTDLAWTLAVEEFASGRVALELTGARSDEGCQLAPLSDLAWSDLLALQFEVLDATATEVRLLDSALCVVPRYQSGLNTECEPTALPSLSATIGRDVVKDTRASFGAIKARFRQ